jgi:HSP20 family molecular chaperone IbpA
MNCKKCKNDINGKWKFCPFCGEGIGNGFLGFFGKPKRELSPDEEMEKEMEKMSRRVEGMLKIMGFPGKINIRIGKGPQMAAPQQHANRNAVKVPVHAAEEDETSQMQAKEVLEPLTKSTKTAEGIKYVLTMPGVLNTNDIKIRQFQESIEIRAYARDKAYFKVIPIMPNSQIVDKKYQDEMLKIVIG